MAASDRGRLELARVVFVRYAVADGNFTAGVGCPTLDGMGAVGGGAHAETEHVVVAQIPNRTALLAALIDAVCGGAAVR